MTRYLTTEDGRRNAAADQDPLMLIGPDMIHYAELLIRLHDHPPLSPGCQFWGNLADYLNRIMHLPELSSQRQLGRWQEFNSAIAMAAGYVRDVSPASAGTKMALLRKFFPPPPETETEPER